VSHEVAERVGVRSLRRLLLAANADSMDLAVGTAEAFGQHEALTVRLKHIVEMYADGPGILCELVQVQLFLGVLLSGLECESRTMRKSLHKPGPRPSSENAESSITRMLSGKCCRREFALKCSAHVMRQKILSTRLRSAPSAFSNKGFDPVL
jgi:hypothetical protein